MRFRYKTLLLVGLGFLGLAAVGSGLSINFYMMVFSFAFTGVGVAMIQPMLNTLAGEHFSLENRSSVIGWIQAGTSIAFLVGSPAVSYVAGLSGWRFTFLMLMLPVCLISLITGYFSIPNTQNQVPEETSYYEGLREIVSKKSPFFCLVGTILAATTWGGSLTYMMSYFRQSFLLATTWASLLLSGLALSKTFGALISSRFINRFGRRPVTVIAMFLLSFLTLGYLNINYLWSSIILISLSCVADGFMETARTSLTLEQVTTTRGSMMSLSRAMYQIGSTLGAGLGGLIIISYGYAGLGVFLGLSGIIATLIYQIFTVGPTSRKN